MTDWIIVKVGNRYAVRSKEKLPYGTSDKLPEYAFMSNYLDAQFYQNWWTEEDFLRRNCLFRFKWTAKRAIKKVYKLLHKTKTR